MRNRKRPIQRGARLVVVGAGFARASLIRNLPQALRRPGETLLIDHAEAYTFAPLIHEVAVGRLHPDSVRSPIAPIARDRCTFLQTDVTGVDLEDRALETSSGRIGYEYLALAAGSSAARPPEALAQSFRPFGTLDDALRLRGTLNEAWSSALDRGRAGTTSGTLTAAIVGGGATGVELASEISVLFDYLKRRSSRAPAVRTRVVLLEATDRLLGWLNPYFHEVAMDQLPRLGVEVRLNTPVRSGSGEGVQAGDEWLLAQTRVWTTGIKASPLTARLPGQKDAAGRVTVDEHLTVPEHPEVYVLGDSSAYEDPRHGSLFPTASLAVQQGPWVARDLGRRLGGSRRRPPFDFFNRGYVVGLGPESAIAETLGARFSGPSAQALYRSILLYYLKSRRGRILTGADWAMERTIGRVGFGTREGQGLAAG
ncbi:MAG: NAD(P)/FAD-dependent oxidoreductase [Rubrobacteraceae bacterium]